MENQSMETTLQSCSWKEIACRYNPGLKPDTATKRLRHWLAKNRNIEKELQKTGWRKGDKILTPVQIKILYHFWGEP